ncbi:MAG: MarR family transcriptional regulator [Nitrososphaerales archaeon]|nr:MarR family transcriptional regulator [Nitrososphaerales archaeon]
MQATTEPGLELWQSIRTVYRTALKRLNARLAKEKISFSQYSVLLALSRNGPMPMSRLGEHMLVAPANVTGLVDRMESKGFVRRRRDRKDRRLYVIEPTQEGSRIFKNISSRFVKYASSLSSTLSPGELASALSALRKVREKVAESTEI